MRGKANDEVCEVVDDTEYQSSVQYLNTLQTIIKEIQGISVNTSSDIKYLLDRIQNLEQDIQTIKKCVTKDPTAPTITNGLYQFTGTGSSLQDRLSSFVGKQNQQNQSHLFNGGIGAGNLLEQSHQRLGINPPILNTSSNMATNLSSGLQQRLGKFSNIVEQQGARVPLKRNRPAIPNGRKTDGNEQGEDVTVLSDDQNKKSKVTENVNQPQECLPVEVGSKRGTSLSNAVTNNLQTSNLQNKLRDMLKPTTLGNTVVDPKKRTNIRKVVPASKGGKDDVMVVDEADEDMPYMPEIACDVIIDSGEGTYETISEQKVDMMLDNLLDGNIPQKDNVKNNNAKNNTEAGKEVDLMLDELIKNNPDMIQNNPEILEDILAQVPFAKSKLNKNNKTPTQPKANKNSKAPKETKNTKTKESLLEKALAVKPKAKSKDNKETKDVSDNSNNETSLDDNLQAFANEEAKLPLDAMDLPLF